MDKVDWDNEQVIEEESSNLKCYHCGSMLTKSDYEEYMETAEYCCDGHMCGCMGMPISPPFCGRCIETARLAEIGEAIEDAMNYFSLGQPNSDGVIEFKILNVEELLEWHKTLNEDVLEE